MEWLDKKFKQNVYSSILIWLFALFILSITFSIYPVFLLLKENIIISSTYLRFGLTVFLNTLIGLFYSQLMGIFKKTQNTDFFISEDESDGFRIVFFKRCAIFFDRISSNFLELIHFLQKEKIFLVSSLLLFVASVIWSLLSPVFFIYVLTGQLVCIFAYLFVFGMLYWAINASHNLWLYTVFESKYLTSKKIDEFHLSLKKELSFLSWFDKGIEFLKLNDFKKVLGYISRFEIASFISSLSITLFSYIIVAISPLLRLPIRFLNTKYLWFLLGPIFFIIKILILVVREVINAFFLLSASLYSSFMTLFSILMGITFVYVSHFVFSNGISSVLYWILVVVIYIIILSIWAMISYSLCYNLLQSYNPFYMIKRIFKIDESYNHRSKIKSICLYLIFSTLFIIGCGLLFNDNLNTIIWYHKELELKVDSVKKELVYLSTETVSAFTEINEIAKKRSEE